MSDATYEDEAPRQPGGGRDKAETLVASKKGTADPVFIHKLIAAHAFKDHIQSAGHQIDRNLLADLNELLLVFEADVRARLRVLGLEPEEPKPEPNQKEIRPEDSQNAPAQS